MHSTVEVRDIDLLKYIAKRLLLALVVMLCVSILIFFILRLAPGDPVRLILGDTATEEQMEQKRIELGYDKPFWVQYGIYLTGLLRGDLGTSIFFHRPVAHLVFPAMSNTLKLTGSALLVALLIAVPLGIIAGVKRGSIIDVISMGFALLGQSMSPVWLGILLVLVFAVNLGWLPAFGTDSVLNVILPSLTLGMPMAAITTRMIRSGMIDTLEEDFILTTRARGVPERKVIFKYALKNVLLPVITVVGMQVGIFLGGAVVTEQVFAWNGVGRLMVASITRRDFPVVQSCLLTVSLFFVLINVFVDIVYMMIDPRLRLVSGGRRARLAAAVEIIKAKNGGSVDEP